MLHSPLFNIRCRTVESRRSNSSSENVHHSSTNAAVPSSSNSQLHVNSQASSSQQQNTTKYPSASSPLQTASHSEDRDVSNSQNSSPYVTTNISKMCRSAYLSKELEKRPKCTYDLRPQCRHLKCLIHRMIVIFNQFDSMPSVLHVTLNDHSISDIRQTPSSYFVVEKLLQAGANVKVVDGFGFF